MIRINLLEEQRAPKKGAAVPAAMAAPGAAAPVPIFIFLLQALIPILVLLAVAALWVMWGGEKRSLDSKIEEARAEVARLQQVNDLAKRLEQKKALLERKIGVIEKLKEGQQLPVVMMDQISQNLVDLVWFDSLRQTGQRISLQGKAQTDYAIASFIRNLERSCYFAGIVPESIMESGGLRVWSMSFDFQVCKPKEPAAQVSELR